MKAIEDLDIDVLLGLIQKIKSEKEEQKAWSMWLQLYPDMIIPRRKVQVGNTIKLEPHLKFVPFSQFYQKLTQPISKRPTEDILREAEEIRARIRKGTKK